MSPSVPVFWHLIPPKRFLSPGVVTQAPCTRVQVTGGDVYLSGSPPACVTALPASFPAVPICHPPLTLCRLLEDLFSSRIHGWKQALLCPPAPERLASCFINFLCGVMISYCKLFRAETVFVRDIMRCPPQCPQPHRLTSVTTTGEVRLNIDIEILRV